MNTLQNTQKKSVSSSHDNNDDDDFVKIEKMTPNSSNTVLHENLVFVPPNHAVDKIKCSCSGTTLSSGILINSVLSNKEQFKGIQLYEKVLKNWDTYTKTRNSDV